MAEAEIFLEKAMYAVLLVSYHGEPTLVTDFASRQEFLKAMDLDDSPSGWLAACRHERAVFEITAPDQVETVMREVSETFPDMFETCAAEIAHWLRMHPPGEAAKAPPPFK